MSSSTHFRSRRLSVFLAIVMAVSVSVPAPSLASGSVNSTFGIAYDHLALPSGRYARVYRDGRAVIFSKDRRVVEFRRIPRSITPSADNGGSLSVGLPDQTTVLADLMKPPPQRFVEGSVVVVFRSGTAMPQDQMQLASSVVKSLRAAVARRATSATAVPQYTNDAATNRILASLTVDRAERLFRNVSRGSLQNLYSRAQSRSIMHLVNFSNAYRLHLTGSSTNRALEQLRKLPSVEFADRDWMISTTQAPAVQIARPETDRAYNASGALRQRSLDLRTQINIARTRSLFVQAPAAASASPAGGVVPSNYDLASSGQSLLNAPGVDAVAAFDEIHRHFGQLPGQGEIVTNVSIGDLDDASAVSNANDPCNAYASYFGPTTKIIGGQRYIDWPAMPLIPTYVADDAGSLSGQNETCGNDPFLEEVGLDFSMMAPLPDGLQRPGKQGTGLGDLFGIAPGAQYRLVVPGTPTLTGMETAFLGAALQTPQPNVITASLGFGFDAYGFPGRFLEDDPIMQAIIFSVVNDFNVVMCISANDGTRLYTNVAIGASGGSAATNLVQSGVQTTTVDDVGFSTAPSADRDSGSIDVGGTTLDDIFSVPPQYSSGAAQAQHAYAETRWSGITTFSSGFGTRVNVSAPSDNVIAAVHYGSTADSVAYVISGGTSASAPEVAAAAAVALQVARLTGQPSMTPAQVRSLLERTGSPVPQVPQADQPLNVGPQVDVRRVVETLLRKNGKADGISVPRVAVEQRRNMFEDVVFLSDTNPNDIDLQGLNGTGFNSFAWITIAPDWEFTDTHTRYSLTVASTKRELAATPWARLQPQAILTAAGLPFASTSTRTVNLKYTATGGAGSVSATFSLTFGPSDGTTYEPLAPQVPAVVTGPTIPVTYDLTNLRLPGQPTLAVSQPGRFNPFTNGWFRPAYTKVLTAMKGTVDVPVSALQGAGIYGIAIYNVNGEVNGTGQGCGSPLAGPQAPGVWSAASCYTDFAYTRVVPPNFNGAQTAAPLLSIAGTAPAHGLEIPYGTPFQVTYDVRNVPNATGAILEVSAPGPTLLGNYNTFNNPSGSIPDHNGVDSPSVYSENLSGTSGTVTLDPVKVGLIATMNHLVRVIATNGGRPIAEAGAASTISMDGVNANDGGLLFWGFNVNPNGTDGYLTTWGFTGYPGSAGSYSALSTFDQTTNQIKQVIGAGTSSLYLGNPAPGIYGNDIGLFGQQDTSVLPTDNFFDFVFGYIVNGNPSYHLLSPATGTVGANWTPPYLSNSFRLDYGAMNAVTDNATFLGYDTTAAANDNFRLFTSDLQSGTYGTPSDISPLFSYANGDFPAMAQNTATSTLVLTDAPPDCAPIPATTITSITLANGSSSSFTGLNAGVPGGIALDPATNRLAALDGCSGGVSFYDLNSRTGIRDVPFDPHDTGVPGFGIAFDPVSKHFLAIDSFGAPDYYANSEAMGTLYVYDESGNLLETREILNSMFGFVLSNNTMLQLNPSRHTGYTFGAGETQLQPFSY